MSYTDNDFINLGYYGGFNNMPYITISESDKSHVDEIFINSSYSGKVLTSEAPISEHIFDGELEFEDGRAYITEAFSMDTTKSYKITVADTSFTNEGLTYNSTSTEPPICDIYCNTNYDVQVWKLAEAFEEMYGQVAINPSMITDGTHHVTIDEAETPTPSHLFDEDVSFDYFDDEEPFYMGLITSEIESINDTDTYSLTVGSNAPKTFTFVTTTHPVTSQTVYFANIEDGDKTATFNYVPDGFESGGVLLYSTPILTGYIEGTEPTVTVHITLDKVETPTPSWTQLWSGTVEFEEDEEESGVIYASPDRGESTMISHIFNTTDDYKVEITDLSLSVEGKFVAGEGGTCELGDESLVSTDIDFSVANVEIYSASFFDYMYAKSSSVGEHTVKIYKKQTPTPAYIYEETLTFNQEGSGSSAYSTAIDTSTSFEDLGLEMGNYYTLTVGDIELYAKGFTGDGLLYNYDYDMDSEDDPKFEVTYDEDTYKVKVIIRSSALESGEELPNGNALVTISDGPVSYTWDGYYRPYQDIGDSSMFMHKFTDELLTSQQLIGSTLTVDGYSETITSEIIQESGGFINVGSVISIGVDTEIGMNGSYFINTSAPLFSNSIYLTLTE